MEVLQIQYDQSMFALTIFKEIKEAKTRFSQESVTILWKIANYKEVRVKLTNAHLFKLKSTVKDKIEATLKINEKDSQDQELPRELLLTIRQKKKKKKRNVFGSNMSKNIKLFKTQISKVIQSGWFLSSTIGDLDKTTSNVGKKAITDFGIPLAKDDF